MPTHTSPGVYVEEIPSGDRTIAGASTSNTPMDVALGIVNIIVGFAPLKPAEFVILKIKLIAGQDQA